MKRSDDSLLDFTPTDELPDSVRGEFESLLREAHSLKGYDKRLKEVKDRIRDIAVNIGGAGLSLRFGDLCTVVRFQDGKRTLSRELLIENGVTPEQIELSMKQGNGGWVVELPRVGGDVAGRD